MATQAIMRIARDLADIRKGPDLSIAVAHRDADVRRVSALIIGPPETPYQYGFFEFDVKFPPDYPLKPPKVTAKTTNSGRCRFNPNIYASGMVCLSTLGTWTGDNREEWSSAQGLESVLLSIQSLMSSTPWANEPGQDMETELDKADNTAYCFKIVHETIRIAVIQPLERALGLHCSEVAESTHDQHSNSSDFEALTEYEPFQDLKKQRFLWYYESYLQAIRENEVKNKDGTEFSELLFESADNGMRGTFQHEKLRERLVCVKEAIDQETRDWAAEGLKEMQKDSSVASSLNQQFKQYAAYEKTKNVHNIDINLDQGNPFVWVMTYFGKSGSNLEGGVFRIRLSLSPRFPEERPRVTVETRMYHHRVSKDGVLCFSSGTTEDVKVHIDAIILALEEASPRYDPRTVVHLEASQLFWGDDGDRKMYARKQRRSAQDSVEQ